MTDRRFASRTFLACFEPKQGSVETAPMPPHLGYRATIETTGYAVTVAYGEPDMLTVSADGQTTLLLVGEVYRPQAADVGQMILNLYERHDVDFIQTLNGSFALLVVDRQRDQIMIATDRKNACRLFVHWDHGTLAVSNSIYLQPADTSRIDQTALACYLAAGVIYNDRTLLEDVRVLEAGSMYRLRAGTLHQRRYWQVTFSGARVATPIRVLRRELDDLLVEAVRIRLHDDRATYLSLSGGHDSRAVLGVLSKQLHIPDVRCFSYTYGEMRPDSDEAIAGLLARQAHYSHELVSSFSGAADAVLRRNAQFGGALAEICDEVDAWLTLSERVKHQPMPVLFTGDTILMPPGLRVSNAAEAASAAWLDDFSVVSWTEPLLGKQRYAACVDATRAEIDRAVKRCPPTEDAYDLRDILRFDQFHIQGTSAWREYFAGRFFQVAQPLMDDDLLNFLLSLPADLRRDKRFFVSAVAAMFPALFALPQAHSASYASYWPAALQQIETLNPLIEQNSSPLDAILDPDILSALLAADMASYTRPNALLGTALKKAYRLLRRLNGQAPAFARQSLFRGQLPASLFLKRAITARLFLAGMASRPQAQVASLRS